MTAATAPATAPRTVVAAVASLEGFFEVVVRLEREAAARAAVLRFAPFVLWVRRRREAGDFFVDLLRLDFAGLVDFRFATVPPFLVERASGVAAARNRS